MMRKLLAKYKSGEWVSFYNSYVQEHLMPELNIQPCVHILDCTKVLVNLTAKGTSVRLVLHLSLAATARHRRISKGIWLLSLRLSGRACADCTKVLVNLDNGNYENSSVVKIDGETMRGYKLGVLRGIAVASLTAS